MAPIEVNNFPFLIGRDQAFFSKYEDSSSSRIRALSRQHAQIILEKGTFYLRDLGSKNGTTLSGKKVTDRPVPLSDGDQVAFATIFKFTVRLNQQETIQTLSYTVKDKTVFISSPSSFIKVLSQQSKKDKFIAKRDIRLVSDLPQPDEKKPIFKVILEYLSSNSKHTKHRIWYILASVVFLLIAVLSWVFTAQSPEQKLQNLLAKGQYIECLEIADTMLSKYPENENLRILATQALLKNISSEWISKLDHSLFADARAILVEYEARSHHNYDGLEIIELLNWIIDLEQFASGKSTETQLITINDENQIKSLIDRWDRNKNENSRLLEQIANQESSLTQIRERVFSKLNMVRAAMALYLPAVQELKGVIQKKLDSGQPQALIQVLDEFENQYPEVGGMAFLRKDLNQYITLWHAIQDKRILAASRLLRDSQFNTPPFTAKVANLSDNFLPPDRLIDDYSRAAEAWSSGDGKGAISILEPLVHEKCGEIALAKIEHCRNILKTLDQLENARAKPYYDELLLSLYSALEPKEDKYYIEMLEKDFQKIKSRSLNRAKELFMLAEEEWAVYVKHGRISGLLRLENTVSDTFRLQTQRLLSSVKNASTGIKIYYQLNQIPPTEWKTLEKQIMNEIEVQQMLLNDMGSIMDPTLLAEKLKLLTIPSNETSR